jgi:hypothetical protein
MDYTRDVYPNRWDPIQRRVLNLNAERGEEYSLRTLKYEARSKLPNRKKTHLTRISFDSAMRARLMDREVITEIWRSLMLTDQDWSAASWSGRYKLELQGRRMRPTIP